MNSLHSFTNETNYNVIHNIQYSTILIIFCIHTHRLSYHHHFCVVISIQNMFINGRLYAFDSVINKRKRPLSGYE